MRTLQVITDTDRRGAQQFALDIGDGLRTLGHDVHTVALAPGRQQNPTDVEVLGSRRLSLGTVRALRRRMADADVTIAHGSSTAPACALAGIGHPAFVYRQISDPMFWARTPGRRLRVAAYMRRAAQVICLSTGVESVFRAHYWLPDGATTVIPNAVPDDRFFPQRSSREKTRTDLGIAVDAPVVLYVGALAQEKGVDLAISAVAEVDEATLVIAGDGPDRDRLEQCANELLPKRVIFMGAVTDPVPLYRAADVFLFPTRGGDSMPAVLIEAGLCGLPAVVCPIGAIEEIVVNDQTGTVVRDHDPIELAAAVERLLSSGETRQRLGSNARSHCLERFTITSVAPAWERVLVDCGRDR